MHTSIQISENITVPMGNAAYLYEIIKDSDTQMAADTFEKFLHAEACRRTNPRDCYNVLRQVIENTAYDVTACYMRDAGISNEDYPTIRNALREESKHPGKASMCKRLIKDAIIRFDRNPANPQHIRADRILKKPLERFRKQFLPNLHYLKAADFARYIYSEACNGDHTVEESYFHGTEIEQKAGLLTESIFYLVQFLKTGNIDHAYVPLLSPIGPYFPVRPALYQQLGLDDYLDCDFFVRDAGGNTTWYILKSVDESDPASVRDASSLYRLWNMNVHTPACVLRPMESIHPAGGGLLQVYLIPGSPMPFCAKSFAALPFASRIQIAMGLTDGILSLHTAYPPMPHRSLTPHEILICSHLDTLRPVIISFESVKDLSDNSGMVTQALRSRARDGLRRQFLAPEVFFSETCDLTKADIYSFGKLLQMIFEPELSGAQTSGSVSQFTSELKALIRDMTIASPLPDRPSITQVKHRLAEMLPKRPVCVVYSSAGRRREQQDAVFIHGTQPIMADYVMKKLYAAEPVVAAVFDGRTRSEDTANVVMLAAATLENWCTHVIRSGTDNLQNAWRKLPEILEEALQSYKAEHNLFSVGTTIAAVSMFTEADTPDSSAGPAGKAEGRAGRIHVLGMNLGDSRIYLIRHGIPNQLSTDHRFAPAGRRRHELYQYLGASDERVGIAPYVFEAWIGPEDRLLLCTDGLSDLLDDKEIGTCMSGSITESAGRLRACAEQKGLSDNISIILIGKETTE